MKKYVSISELVKMGYGCRTTIKQHVAEGGFNCKNPGGGKWIIDLEDYERWLSERQETRKRYVLAIRHKKHR